MPAKKKSNRSSSPKKSRKSTTRKTSKKNTQPAFASLTGPFNGQINTPGLLHIAPGANFNATINAGAVQLDGSFKGKLTAKGDVLITKGAKVNGDFTANCILIEEGANFDGRCKVNGVRRAA